MGAVLEWSYLEASKYCKNYEKRPLFAEYYTGAVEKNKLDAYWAQYYQELEDFFAIARLNVNLAGRELKLGKLHTKLILCLGETIGLGAGADESTLQEILVNFINHLILVKLMPRQCGQYTLPRPVWDRHALLTETVNSIQNLYIYKKRVFTEDQRRKWFMCVLALLDHMVEVGLIKRELIEQKEYKNEIHAEAADEGQKLVYEDITKPNKKQNTSPYKTIYIYQFEGLLTIPFTVSGWNLSYIPYTAIILSDRLIYLKSVSFNSIHKATLENRYSNRHFWLEDLSILDKLKQQCAHLNKNLYELVYAEIQIKHTNPTLGGLLESLTQDIKRLKKPYYMPKEAGVEALQEKKKFKIDWKRTKEKNKDLQRRINKTLILLDFILLGEQEAIFNKPLYFVHTFDFRGRIYLKSRISPQASYLFRYIYDYGPLKTGNSQNIGAAAALPLEYERWFIFIAQHIEWFNVLNEADKRLLFWLLIELAKIVKNRFIKKYEGKLHIQQFLEIGLDVLMAEVEGAMELEKKVQKNYIMYIIKQLKINNWLERDYIIYKDATASAIQLLTYLLGPATSEIKTYANLNSVDSWYDTYYYIISLFIKTQELNPDIAQFFTREFLKQTIMTYNYAATLFTCWGEFKLLVKETTTKNDAEFWRLLRGEFERFYKFLNRLFNEQTLFLKSIDEHADTWMGEYPISKEIMLKSNDNARIYLHYFIPKRKRLTARVEERRKTLQITSLGLELDVKKTKQAIKPNTTHALDATLVRETLRDLDTPIFTIHDCFGINAYKIDSLIISLNKNMGRLHLSGKKLYPEQATACFSIFIVL